MILLKNASNALKVGSAAMLLILGLNGYIVPAMITWLVMFLLGTILEFVHTDLELRKLRRGVDKLFEEAKEEVDKELKKLKMEEENSFLDIHFERLSERESTFDIKGNCSVEDMTLVIVGLAKAAAKNSPLKPEEFLDMAKEMYLENTKMLEK